MTLVKELKNNYPSIKTQFINPPIPIRAYDWIAWEDGKEDNHVHGKTELEAIEDLINWIKIYAE